MCARGVAACVEFAAGVEFFHQVVGIWQGLISTIGTSFKAKKNNL